MCREDFLCKLFGLTEGTCALKHEREEAAPMHDLHNRTYEVEEAPVHKPQYEHEDTPVNNQHELCCDFSAGSMVA